MLSDHEVGEEIVSFRTMNPDVDEWAIHVMESWLRRDPDKVTGIIARRVRERIRSKV